MRSTIHASTRMFSEKPGQTNLPFSSVRNQLTQKIFGSRAPLPSSLWPSSSQCAKCSAML